MSRTRLLVMESDDRIRALLGRFLERGGFDVELVEDGLSGIDAFYRDVPDVVLIDAQLRGVSGPQVCRAIRAHAEVPIVLMGSGRAVGRFLPDELDALGVREVLTRPFKARDLVAGIQTASAPRQPTLGKPTQRGFALIPPEAIEARARLGAPRPAVSELTLFGPDDSFDLVLPEPTQEESAPPLARQDTQELLTSAVLSSIRDRLAQRAAKVPNPQEAVAAAGEARRAADEARRIATSLEERLKSLKEGTEAPVDLSIVAEEARQAAEREARRAAEEASRAGRAEVRRELAGAGEEARQAAIEALDAARKARSMAEELATLTHEAKAHRLDEAEQSKRLTDEARQALEAELSAVRQARAEESRTVEEARQAAVLAQRAAEEARAAAAEERRKIEEARAATEAAREEITKEREQVQAARAWVEAAVERVERASRAPLPLPVETLLSDAPKRAPIKLPALPRRPAATPARPAAPFEFAPEPLSAEPEKSEPLSAEPSVEVSDFAAPLLHELFDKATPEPALPDLDARSEPPLEGDLDSLFDEETPLPAESRPLFDEETGRLTPAMSALHEAPAEASDPFSERSAFEVDFSAPPSVELLPPGESLGDDALPDSQERATALTPPPPLALVPDLSDDDTGAPSAPATMAWEAKPWESDAPPSGSGELEQVFADVGEWMGESSAPKPEPANTSFATVSAWTARDASVTDQLRTEREAEIRYLLGPLPAQSSRDPQGIYGEITLPQLLYRLFIETFTGRLVLRRGDIHNDISVRQGRPIVPPSSLPTEDIARVLLRDGVITSDHYRRAIILRQRSGSDLPKALEAVGVERELLTHHFERFARRRLQGCFSWTDGRYGLVYDATVADQTEVLVLNPLVVIFEGVRAALPIGPLLSHFDEHGRRPCRRTARFDEYQSLLEPFAAELRVADLLDGERPLGEIVARSGYGILDTLRILRALELIDCISFGQALAADPVFSAPRRPVAGRRPKTPQTGMDGRPTPAGGVSLEALARAPGSSTPAAGITRSGEFPRHRPTPAAGLARSGEFPRHRPSPGSSTPAAGLPSPLSPRPAQSVDQMLIPDASTPAEGLPRRLTPTPKAPPLGLDLTSRKTPAHGLDLTGRPIPTEPPAERQESRSSWPRGIPEAPLTPARGMPIIPPGATPARGMPIIPPGATPARGMPIVPPGATPVRGMPLSSGPTPARGTPILLPDHTPDPSNESLSGSMGGSLNGSLSGTAPLEQVDQWLRQLVARKFALLTEGANHYELIGVSSSAPDEALRSVLNRLQKALEAQRVSILGDARVLEQARQVRERLTELSTVLLDEAQRNAYDEELLGPGERKSGLADNLFDEGRRCLREGNASAALGFFDLACRQDPNHVPYRVFRGWARFLAADPNDHTERKAGHDELKEALRADGSFDEGFVLLGNIYRVAGQPEMAAKLYRKALDINRRNVVALRALKAVSA